MNRPSESRTQGVIVPMSDGRWLQLEEVAFDAALIRGANIFGEFVAGTKSQLVAWHLEGLEEIDDFVIDALVYIMRDPREAMRLRLGAIEALRRISGLCGPHDVRAARIRAALAQLTAAEFLEDEPSAEVPT